MNKVKNVLIFIMEKNQSNLIFTEFLKCCLKIKDLKNCLQTQKFFMDYCWIECHCQQKMVGSMMRIGCTSR